MNGSSRPWDTEPRSAVVRRRLVTIPRSILVFALLSVLLPAMLAAAALVDLVRWLVQRRPWMAVRLVIFAWVFFAAELWGILWLLWGWMRNGSRADRDKLLAAAWPVQAWWARTLFRTVRALFALDLQVEGIEGARPGPVIALFRHASIVDNLLPAVLLSDDLGLRLRWIIKKELLSVPALDVGGKRLPNYFVDRESEDPWAELEAIRSLSAGLGPDEGVLIYPEGTRFTESRRRRALERLEARGSDLWERASRLRHLMPPKPGGVLELLDTGHDVLICGHDGLSGFARISDLWSGAILRRTVRVSIRRIAAADVPGTRSERVAWLYDQWQIMDDWIAAAAGAV
ncbi:MAG: 1-acyl-sn-glycerol-3-phosphate acyltransferase [Acidimicrobiia bacterium]